GTRHPSALPGRRCKCLRGDPVVRGKAYRVKLNAPIPRYKLLVGESGETRNTKHAVTQVRRNGDLPRFIGNTEADGADLVARFADFSGECHGSCLKRQRREVN